MTLRLNTLLAASLLGVMLVRPSASDDDTSTPFTPANGAPIRHIEYVADDPERAAAFYTGAFGWKVERWDGPLDYWQIEAGGAEVSGLTIGLMQRQQPGEYPVTVVYVESLDDALGRVTGAGGRILEGKTEVPGVGWQAYVADTEGNRLGVFQLRRQ